MHICAISEMLLRSMASASKKMEVMHRHLLNLSLMSFTDGETFLSFRFRGGRAVIALLDATLESPLGNNWADSAI